MLNSNQLFKIINKSVHRKENNMQKIDKNNISISNSKFLKKNWFFFIPTATKITVYYGIIACLFFLLLFSIFAYWKYHYIFLGCIIFILVVLMVTILKWRSVILRIGANKFLSGVYEVYLNEEGLHVNSKNEKYLTDFKYIKCYRWIGGKCILFVADGGFLVLSKKHQELSKKTIKKTLANYQICRKSKWL